MGTFMTKHCGSALNYGSPMKNKVKPKQTYEGGPYDPKVPVEGEVVVKGERQGPSGEIVTKGGVKYRRIGGNLYPIK